METSRWNFPLIFCNLLINWTIAGWGRATTVTIHAGFPQRLHHQSSLYSRIPMELSRTVQDRSATAMKLCLHCVTRKISWEWWGVEQWLRMLINLQKQANRHPQSLRCPIFHLLPFLVFPLFPSSVFHRCPVFLLSPSSVFHRCPVLLSPSSVFHHCPVFLPSPKLLCCPVFLPCPALLLSPKSLRCLSSVFLLSPKFLRCLSSVFLQFQSRQFQTLLLSHRFLKLHKFPTFNSHRSHFWPLRLLVRRTVLEFSGLGTLWYIVIVFILASCILFADYSPMFISTLLIKIWIQALVGLIELVLYPFGCVILLSISK